MTATGIFTRGWDRRVLAVGAPGADIKQQILAAADNVYIDLPFFPREQDE